MTTVETSTEKTSEEVIMERKGAIAKAYRNLAKARNDLWKANEELITSQRNLTISTHGILLKVTDPKELGTNETMRQAKIAELTASEQTAVRVAESNVRLSQVRYELEQYAVAMNRDIIDVISATMRG